MLYAGVCSARTKHPALHPWDIPTHRVWNPRRSPEELSDIERQGGEEIVLTDNYILEGIKEDATILIFLPPPDMERTTTREPSSDQARHLETPPSSHQIFVQVPDTWSETGRKPAYIQTMPIPASLETLKNGLSQLLSIPTQAFRIQYGGKTHNDYCPLETQGITNGTTVWMTIGGLFGGADTTMADTPPLTSSAATPIRRLTQTHYKETQASICQGPILGTYSDRGL